MAPRANWKGYLRLSLVSCPIALYPASSLSEKVSFNRINRKTGNRLKQQNVDSETGEVVSRDDMVRGYEVAKGQYMIVEDEEIEAVQIESTRTIDIDQFVPKNEIDERYIDSPYYIAPDGQVGQEAFAVIRDTIAKLNMVALFAYFAVPTNTYLLSAFRYHISMKWFQSLRRRSQRHRLTWKRMTQLIDRFLPSPCVLHPWPDQRFGVTYSR